MRSYKSFLSLLLIAVVYLISIWCYKPYRDLYMAEGGDSFCYYMYLPAFFIHHDAADLHTTMNAKYSHISPGKKAEGVVPNKYFIGTAVLQAPFFGVAHLLAGPLHQDRDGFSIVYMYVIALSCFFYALMGLFILALILRRYFADGVVAITLLIIALSTNLYFLVTAQAPFCHAYLFFWYALLMYVTIRYYDTLRAGLILLIGAICGMIVLTRPNEMYAVLIPILWGLDTRQSLMERLDLFRRNIAYILGAGVLMVLCFLPQLLWWKASKGQYFYYSYTDEKFNFLHPHILEGLTSFHNGWLTYCPIMWLALAGIRRMWRARHVALAPLVVFTVLHVYIIYSWWCWFYMGSYGSRPMAEAYPLLSIPLAFTVEWMLRTLSRKIVLATVMTICTLLLVSQTYQSVIGIFNSELCNWRFYLITLGKTHLTYEEAIVLDTREFQPRHPVYVRTLREDSFDDPALPGSDTTVSTSAGRSVCVRKDSTFTFYKSTLRASGVKRGQWIKASVNCLSKEKPEGNWLLSQLVTMYTIHDHTSAQWTAVGLQNRINNPLQHVWHFPTYSWGRVYFYSQVPMDMSDGDEIRVYVEHKYTTDVYIDDAKVEVYDGE